KDRSGHDQTIHVGALPTRVSVEAVIVADQATGVPSFLQTLANNVAGRPVSPLRVLLAALLFVILVVVVTVLMYAAIRSSLISIGRNPFSEGALRKALVQAGLVVSAIAIGGLVVVYLILKI